MHASRLILVLLVLSGWLSPSRGTRANAAVDLDAPPPCAAPATPAPASSNHFPATLSPTSLIPTTAVLSLVTDVPLLGGATRFDYQALDPKTGVLWIAHMGDGELLAFDVATRQVIGTIRDLPEVTGVFVAPDTGTVYASSTQDHLVAVIDATTFAVIARLGPISFPDGIDEAPNAHRLFVSDESGDGELVIDTATNEVVTTIAIGGEAGNTRYDAGSGCILVANQSTNQLIAIDPVAATVVARYDLDPRCQGAHGFTVDAPHRLAFVTCESNATLLVIDLTTMRTTAVFPVGVGPDVLAFDPGLGRLYVASEAGTVSIFDERGPSLAAVGAYQAPHAHSIAVDPMTHLVYLPLEDVGGKPVLRIMTPTPSAG